MTKIQKNISQSQEKFVIPYNKYCIDSFKLLIDTEHFNKTNIPNNFTEVSTDTGETIREFKRNSLQIQYNNTTIYIGTCQKTLRGVKIDKVIILFSSKVAENGYFNGIRKENVIDVLEDLKSRGYLDYDNVQTIYKNLYTKDVDVKIDFRFDLNDRGKIKDYNKVLASRFKENHSAEDLHIFSGFNKLGLQAFSRDKSTIKKPFFKFYDKSLEIVNKHKTFFNSFSPELQNEIISNFIYRFEFTLSDKNFMANFGVLNRLEEVLEVSQYKWQEVAKTLLKTNFDFVIKKPKKVGNFTPTEKILILLVEELHKEGRSLREIMELFTSIQGNKLSKHRAKVLFEKIYSMICDSPKEVQELSEKYNLIKKFDAIFGIAS